MRLIYVRDVGEFIEIIECPPNPLDRGLLSQAV